MIFTVRRFVSLMAASNVLLRLCFMLHLIIIIANIDGKEARSMNANMGSDSFGQGDSKMYSVYLSEAVPEREPSEPNPYNKEEGLKRHMRELHGKFIGNEQSSMDDTSKNNHFDFIQFWAGNDPDEIVAYPRRFRTRIDSGKKKPCRFEINGNALNGENDRSDLYIDSGTKSTRGTKPEHKDTSGVGVKSHVTGSNGGADASSTGGAYSVRGVYSTEGQMESAGGVTVGSETATMGGPGEDAMLGAGEGSTGKGTITGTREGPTGEFTVESGGISPIGESVVGGIGEGQSRAEVFKSVRKRSTLEVVVGSGGVGTSSGHVVGSVQGGSKAARSIGRFVGGPIGLGSKLKGGVGPTGVHMVGDSQGGPNVSHAIGEIVRGQNVTSRIGGIAKGQNGADMIGGTGRGSTGAISVGSGGVSPTGEGAVINASQIETGIVGGSTEAIRVGTDGVGSNASRSIGGFTGGPIGVGITGRTGVHPTGAIAVGSDGVGSNDSLPIVGLAGEPTGGGGDAGAKEGAAGITAAGVHPNGAGLIADDGVGSTGRHVVGGVGKVPNASSSIGGLAGGPIDTGMIGGTNGGPARIIKAGSGGVDPTGEGAVISVKEEGRRFEEGLIGRAAIGSDTEPTSVRPTSGAGSIGDDGKGITGGHVAAGVEGGSNSTRTIGEFAGDSPTGSFDVGNGRIGLKNESVVGDLIVTGIIGSAGENSTKIIAVGSVGVGPTGKGEVRGIEGGKIDARMNGNSTGPIAIERVTGAPAAEKGMIEGAGGGSVGADSIGVSGKGSSGVGPIGAIAVRSFGVDPFRVDVGGDTKDGVAGTVRIGASGVGSTSAGLVGDHGVGPTDGHVIEVMGGVQNVTGSIEGSTRANNGEGPIGITTRAPTTTGMITVAFGNLTGVTAIESGVVGPIGTGIVADTDEGPIHRSNTEDARKDSISKAVASGARGGPIGEIAVGVGGMGSTGGNKAVGVGGVRTGTSEIKGVGKDSKGANGTGSDGTGVEEYYGDGGIGASGVGSSSAGLIGDHGVGPTGGHVIKVIGGVQNVTGTIGESTGASNVEGLIGITTGAPTFTGMITVAFGNLTGVTAIESGVVGPIGTGIVADTDEGPIHRSNIEDSRKDSISKAVASGARGGPIGEIAVGVDGMGSTGGNKAVGVGGVRAGTSEIKGVGKDSKGANGTGSDGTGVEEYYGDVEIGVLME